MKTILIIMMVTIITISGVFVGTQENVRIHKVLLILNGRISEMDWIV